MKNIFKKIIPLVGTLFLLITAGCVVSEDGLREDPESSLDEKINIVATTTMITDLLNQIGGEHVEVTGLMGAGIDPHGYTAKPSDSTALFYADVIIYNGLHLEGQLGNVLEEMQGSGKVVWKLEDGLSESNLLQSEEDEGAYDPHIWFDIQLWKEASNYVTALLSNYDANNASTYAENNQQYQSELTELETYVREQIEEVPAESRYLVTAHDAFSYFGQAYDFEVIGIQGLNTQTESGTGDISRLADLIAEQEIKSIFIEVSVSTRNIESLQEAVNSRGFQVGIGGELYSDSLGDETENAETYIKMFKQNVDTIVEALR